MTISELQTLSPGQRVALDFRVLTSNTWLRAAQLWAVEDKLEGLPYVKYLGYHDAGAVITFEVEVVTPDPSKFELQEAGVTGTLIAAAIIGAGLFTWLALKEIRVIGLEVLASSPEGAEKVAAVQAASGSTFGQTVGGYVGLVIVGLVIYGVWRLSRAKK